MKLQFIEDWKLWWRRWSVQFAAIAALLLSAVAANPGPVLDLIQATPAPFRWMVPLLTFAVSFGVPTTLLLLRQPKLEQHKETTRG